MTEKEQEILQNVDEALKVIGTAARGWDEANRVAVDGAKKKMIRLLNYFPEIKETRHRMSRYKPWFSDMGSDRLNYGDVLVCFERDNSENLASYMAYLGGSLEMITTKRAAALVPQVLLHEMIHFHLAQMTGAERATCYVGLLQKVGKKIPDLDVLLGLKDIVSTYRNRAERESLPDPDSHSNLFFVKSLDLDIRARFEPGTVFGYGMDEAIADIRDRMERVAEMRQEIRFLNVEEAKQ